MTVRKYGMNVDLGEVEAMAEELAYGASIEAMVIEAYRQEDLDKDPECWGDLFLITDDDVKRVLDEGVLDWTEARGYASAEVKAHCEPLEDEG